MADEDKTPSPSLPPKLDLSKLSGRAAPKPDTDEPDADEKATASTTPDAKPTLPRPAATPPGPLPRPGPAGGSASASSASQGRAETIRLKPKLPPPRPTSSAPDTAAPVRPAAATSAEPSAQDRPVLPEPEAAGETTEATTATQPTTPEPATASQSKRETSRIPLESAQPGAPKTIRIKPVAKPETPAPATGNDDAKRRTSRISLDSALGVPDNDPGGPKTIRLKRPADPGADKIVPPAAAEGKEAFSKTAPIEAAAADIPLTQKKTIKVKRPGQGPGAVRSAPLVRRSGGPAEGDAVEVGTAVAAMASTAKAEDRAHWTFITFSILSIVILIVTVYMFAAQAFGPNLSLTRLSYGAEGMELPWPGRLAR